MSCLVIRIAKRMSKYIELQSFFFAEKRPHVLIEHTALLSVFYNAENCSLCTSPSLNAKPKLEAQ